MNYLYSYFITYYFMLCIVFVMTIICIQKFREHRKMSVYIFIIMGLVLTLSIVDTVKLYTQNELKNATLTILLSSLSYVLRPTCLLLFILLSGQRTKGVWFYVLLAPLAVCTIIFVLPLIPGTKDLVFTFAINDLGNLVFMGGTTPLRFTAHIVSALYLVYLLYRSLASVQAKHLAHSTVIIVCAFVVTVAVIIETFFNDTGDLQLLTTSIAISVIFYYLYLFTEHAKYDPLTGLLNRAAYYSDLPRMNKDITGIIQVDMNGLKYLNDHFGHQAGDQSLQTIAHILKSESTRRMYVYRIGGDEFTILVNKDDEGKIIDVLRNMQHELAKTQYRCSFGYAFRNKKNTSVDVLIRLADERMYEDKSEFYKHAGIERRRSVNPNE